MKLFTESFGFAICEIKRCHECGLNSYFVIQMGEELDCDSKTVLICLPCLEEAMSMMKPEVGLGFKRKK